MKISKNLSVSISLLQFEAIEKLPQKEKRSIDEIVQEALRKKGYSKAGMSLYRLVLDTNVLVSALINEMRVSCWID
jgi:hypothetical protein